MNVFSTLPSRPEKRYARPADSACLAQRFPRVELKRGRRFVQSGDRVFTAGGLTSGVDLALHIVARYYGDAVAQKTARYMEYEGTGWRSGEAR